MFGLFGKNKIEYKSVDQIRLMRRAGMVVHDALAAAEDAAKAGVTTAELNKAAEQVIRQAGATPSFLGYGNPPFPAVICVSVNDQIVHGIPGGRVLAPGDLVSVDCGAIVDGWHGDSARSFVIPGGDQQQAQARQQLSEATKQCMWAGIAQLVVGHKLSRVGGAIEQACPDGYGLVVEYTGHGIGSQLHMPPEVLNFEAPSRVKLKPGMCLAVEPMLTMSDDGSTQLEGDQWTVTSTTGEVAAHWEHSVALTEAGPWVLTAADGGAAELDRLGVARPELSDAGELL